MKALPIPDSADEITPEWLSAVLEAPVGSVEILPVTTGFISSTLRVSLDFDRPQDHLPDSLIVKLPHPDPKFRKARGPIYAREAAFYRDFGTDLSGSIPRCFFAAHDRGSGRSAIVMEDETATAGVRVGNDREGCTWDEAVRAVQMIARIHARWWNSSSLRDVSWLPTHASLYADPVHVMSDAWSRASDEFRAIMSPALVETVELFSPRAATVAERTSEEPWTLTHGDYRMDNVLLGPGTQIKVFDWQFVSRGQGARDVTYLAVFAHIGGKPIEDTWQPLLDAYHAALTDFGVIYP